MELFEIMLRDYYDFEFSKTYCVALSMEDAIKAVKEKHSEFKLVGLKVLTEDVYFSDECIKVVQQGNSEAQANG